MVQKEDRRIGSIIGGKWRVDSLLGTGSMAAVYAVTHRNGVHAALKILHPSLCTDPQVCERFLGEGYLTNSVKHPGIVRVLDDGMTDDGCVFLVMDLLDGMTLEALRQERGGKIGLEETLDIADSLMDALIAVHKAGIIHRDLKPQNVFVCANGDVKLLDFGVARVLETTKAKNKMSLFGMVLGTPSFMSPEQAIGARDAVDHRADIWSLGATIFTSLTGETVHLGPHVQARLLAAGTVQARSISLVKQDLPPAIAAVLDTSLRFDKAERWQSVEAFRRALKEARNAAGLGEPAPVSSVAPRLRTLMGGISAADVMAAAFPKPAPARATLPYGAPEQHTGAAAALPVAIIRAPIANTEEDVVDDSYPAVHTPYPHLDETDALMSQLSARRTNPLVWLGSIALLVLAVGGVAFFAMGDHASDDATSVASAAAAAPATLTSAVAPPTTPTTPTNGTMVIGDPEAARVDASAPPHVASRPVAAPVWRPRVTQRNPSPPSVAPAPEPTPTPAATSTLAPDPFSTPE